MAVICDQCWMQIVSLEKWFLSAYLPTFWRKGSAWGYYTCPIPGVLVWKAIRYDGRITLVDVQDTMPNRHYVERVINPFVIFCMITIWNAIFQQDNGRSHTVVIPQQAFDRYSNSGLSCSVPRSIIITVRFRYQ